MTDPLLIVVLLFAVLVGLPSLTYMVVKFGAAGYFRAKQRDRETNRNKNE